MFFLSWLVVARLGFWLGRYCRVVLLGLFARTGSYIGGNISRHFFYRREACLLDRRISIFRFLGGRKNLVPARYGATHPQVLKPRMGWHGKRCERGLEPSEARLTGVPRALLPRPPRCVSRGGSCCRAEGRKNLVSAQDITKNTPCAAENECCDTPGCVDVGSFT